MSLDTTAIADFVKNNAEITIKKVLFQFNSAQHIRIRPGIKHKETFGRIATDAIWQAATCGWNPLGKTKLDDIELEVTKIEIKSELCQQDLDDTYYNLLGEAGSLADAENFNLESEFVEAKTGQAQHSLERNIWRGDEALGLSDPLGLFRGFILRLGDNIPDARTGAVTAVADVVGQPYVEVTIDTAEILEDGVTVTLDLIDAGYDGTFEIHNVQTGATTTTFCIINAFTGTSTGTWTEDNDQLITATASVIDDFYSLMDAMPQEFHDLPDKKFYLSPVDYRLLRKNIIDLGGTGNFHVDLTQPADNFMFPGEDVMVVRVSGMTGATERILTYKDNLWFGTDLINDYETNKFFYDEGEDVHKFIMKAKGGTQVVHTHMVGIAS